jgi:hypothetical protein
MSVLNVRTGVSLEVQKIIPLEVNCFNTVVPEVVEDNRRSIRITNKNLLTSFTLLSQEVED